MPIRFTIDKDGQGIVDIYYGDTYKKTVYCNNYMLLQNNEYNIEDVLKSFKEVQWDLERTIDLHHVLESNEKTLLYTDEDNTPYFHIITEEDNI